MREPFVVREKGTDTWNSMEDGFGGDLRDINVAMEIPSTETIKQAVIAGMGVSFVSAHTISQELKAGSLRVLDVEGFPLMLNWYVVHRRTKRLPPVAQAFKDFLLSDGASLIAQIVPSRLRTPTARRGRRSAQADARRARAQPGGARRVTRPRRGSQRRAGHASARLPR